MTKSQILSSEETQLNARSSPESPPIKTQYAEASLNRTKNFRRKAGFSQLRGGFHKKTDRNLTHFEPMQHTLESSNESTSPCLRHSHRLSESRNSETSEKRRKMRKMQNEGS
ncbi:hypothetical protein ACLOJK_032440, partial [Asimina triloba]